VVGLSNECRSGLADTVCISCLDFLPAAAVDILPAAARVLVAAASVSCILTVVPTLSFIIVIVSFPFLTLAAAATVVIPVVLVSIIPLVSNAQLLLHEGVAAFQDLAYFEFFSPRHEGHPPPSFIYAILWRTQ
jgi:hypothetical protein